jgi:DNA-binding XRE family transcriptional regulator
MAEELGTTRQCLSNAELGFTFPRKELCQKIEKLLGVKVFDIALEDIVLIYKSVSLKK